MSYASIICEQQRRHRAYETSKPTRPRGRVSTTLMIDDIMGATPIEETMTARRPKKWAGSDLLSITS